MLSLGVILVIIGIGSFVLPMMGLQFRIMEPIEQWQPWAGIIVAAIGLITVIFAGRRRAASTTVVEPPD
jgi:protein-S-isoprenylcysteine O-methyltransferase Ste14